jgi:hypothetical protein
MTMKSYLAVILASGLVCGGWALGKGAKRTTNEPRFRSRELTHWAHTLTADQTRSTNVLFEIGPSIVPYLVLEIERYQLCRPDYSFALHSFVFSYAPRGIRKFIPAPINQEERRFNAIILLQVSTVGARVIRSIKLVIFGDPPAPSATSRKVQPTTRSAAHNRIFLVAHLSLMYFISD